jgi:hypothetical protein
MNQNRSFPGAGSRHDQHWPVNVLNGFALAIVGDELCRMGLRFRDNHCGSEYHHDQERRKRGLENSDKNSD